MEDNFGDNPEDIQKLMGEIFKNAVDDYTKLQYYPNRDKKYLHETWLTSVAMFFDEDFRFEAFVDIHENPMTIQEFIGQVMDQNNFSIKRLQKFLDKTSYEYWLKKNTHSVHLPDTLVIGGEVWGIEHDLDVAVDYPSRYLYTDRTVHDASAIKGFELIAEILLSKASIKASVEQARTLGQLLFMLIKMNNNFLKTEY